MAAAAVATPGVTVRRGVAVGGSRGRRPGRPRACPTSPACGPTTGEEIAADLVVDATGRRSPLPDWLESAGARRPVEELEDSGFVYYGRHFRSADGTTPPIIGPAPAGLRQRVDPDAAGRQRHVGGGGHRQRGRQGHAGAAPRRALDRRRAQPAPGRALARRRAPRGPDRRSWPRSRTATAASWWTALPVATGVVAVADSWACTNPSLGRGASIGLMHAWRCATRCATTGLDDPAAFSAAWAEATDAVVEPWYRATRQLRPSPPGRDRRRDPGRALPARGDDWDIVQAMFFAAGQDPDCLRAAAVDRQGLRAHRRGGLRRRGAVREGARPWGPGGATRRALGPSRSELLSIVSA